MNRGSARTTEAARRQDRLALMGSAALLLGLAACSPYGYREGTTQFAAAAQNVAGAIQTGRQAAAADRMDLLRTDVGDGRVTVTRAGNCAIPGTPSDGDCRLEPARNAGRYAVDIGVPVEQLAQFDALKLYAASLGALTRAEDREALNTASQRVASAVQGLAGTAGLAAPAATLAGPIVTAVLFVVGESLDYERYLQIRRAVRQAHAELQKMEVVLARVLRRIRQERARLLDDSSTALIGGLERPGRSEDRLQRFDRANDRTAALAAVVRTETDTVVKKMIEAHGALLSALEDPQGNAEALFDAIGRFAAQAEALRDAIGDARAQQ